MNNSQSGNNRIDQLAQVIMAICAVAGLVIGVLDFFFKVRIRFFHNIPLLVDCLYIIFLIMVTFYIVFYRKEAKINSISRNRDNAILLAIMFSVIYLVYSTKSDLSGELTVFKSTTIDRINEYNEIRYILNNEIEEKFDEAIKIIDSFIERYESIGKKPPYIFYGFKGIIFQRQGMKDPLKLDREKLNLSLQEYSKALEIAKQEKDYIFNISDIYKKLCNHGEAVKKMKEYISLSKGDLEGHYSLAVLYHEMGDLDGAKDEYNITIGPIGEKTNPYIESSFYNLAVLYALQFEKDKNTTDFYRSLEHLQNSIYHAPVKVARICQIQASTKDSHAHSDLQRWCAGRTSTEDLTSLRSNYTISPGVTAMQEFDGWFKERLIENNLAMKDKMPCGK